MNNEENCRDVVLSEIHWVVVASLERDGEYTPERMQALKLMERYMDISRSQFPVAFARSIVAVANAKEDSFRKLCLETLRSLSLRNPHVVAFANGFSSLLDAVIEPLSRELADKILFSILYLLDDCQTRYVPTHVDGLLTLCANLFRDTNILCCC
jgi:hypothetical protein